MSDENLSSLESDGFDAPAELTPARPPAMANSSDGRPDVSRGLAIYWIISAALGWVTSFLLFLEYLAQLKDENPIVNCTFSVIVSCTPNLLSPGGNLLGFTNSIFGVTLFLGPLFAGVSSLAGGRMQRWYWRTFVAFIAAAFIFVHVLAYRSVFEYGSLCPWCMVVWLVTIPLFWVTLGWALRSGVFGSADWVAQVGRVISGWAWVIVIVNYLVIALSAELKLQVIESLFI